jgi:outer membrane murein-binding lipoprotein Lpp
LRNRSLKLTAALAATLLAGCVSDGMRAVDGHMNNAVSYVAGPRG